MREREREREREHITKSNSATCLAKHPKENSICCKTNHDWDLKKKKKKQQELQSCKTMNRRTPLKVNPILTLAFRTMMFEKLG